MPEPKWSGRNPPADGAGGSSTLEGLTDVTGTPAEGHGPVYNSQGVADLIPVTTQQDLDDVLEHVANVEWQTPELLSGFRNIGDPWAPCRYRVLANSTVRVEGTIMCQDATIVDATWIPIFTLPAELSPGVSLEFSALTNDNSTSKIYVWADGQVIWGGYAIGDHNPITRLPLNMLSWSCAAAVPPPVFLSRADT